MRTRPSVRAVLVAAAATSIAAAGLLVASPAQAAEFQTYGSGVNVRADATTQSAVVGTLSGPTTIDVDCQKNGERVITDGGGDSTWWAHVPALGGYVTVAYVDIPESQLPGVAECEAPPPAAGDVTLAELEAIYGDLSDDATIEAGLPSLNAAMTEAGITTPARKAAFLATLRNESGFRYNASEAASSATYKGRGFIQITGDFNYGPAGDWLGVDLLGNPELAASLDYSAQIARWYWTVARDINPMADDLDMAAVNVAIGYAPSDAEDAERCADFQAALAYYNGSVPPGVNCTRGATAASSPAQAQEYAQQEQAWSPSD